MQKLRFRNKVSLKGTLKGSLAMARGIGLKDDENNQWAPITTIFTTNCD